MTPPIPTSESPFALVRGDSYKLLEALPDGAVDHVFTDPPYAEKTHSGARTDTQGAPKGGRKLVEFDSITGERFLWLSRQFTRVAKRWVVMTCDWRHAALLEDAMPDEFVRFGVWVKPNGFPQQTGDRPGTGWEAVAILHRKGRKRWNSGGHHAVWTYNKPNNTVHPTQKPVALVREWLRDFTDPGELVLDPFAGSGTTAMACLYEGRRTLNCERDETYCAAIEARTAKLLTDDCLFRFTPAAKVKEPDLLDQLSGE